MQVLLRCLCLLILLEASLVSAAASAPRFVGHYEGEAILQKPHVTDLVKRLDITARWEVYQVDAEMRYIDHREPEQEDLGFWQWGGPGRLQHGTLRFAGTSWARRSKVRTHSGRRKAV